MTFDEVIERLADDRPVDASDVRADALRRRVWVAEWHLPGCLSESREVCTTKRDALESALSMAEGAEGAPRGMRADLLRYGSSDRTSPDAYVRGAITTIKQHALRDLL